MSGAAVYLGLCVAAVLVAACAPVPARRRAVAAALVLLANWLFCEWTYAANAPQNLLYWRTGLYVEAFRWWAAADLVTALLGFLLGRDHWWGVALLLIGMFQMVPHHAREIEAISKPLYLFTLDKLLLAQIALFFMIGGRGVGDGIVRFLGGRADRARAAAAFSEAEG